ncbi:MAG: heat-inducible transcriptional repressor HrcA [Candidatus Bipolaricaulota bacterium]
MHLPERQRLILKEIVDRYIRLREPVSSRMILEDYGLSVSSATVRNDMSDLEKHGYIHKPYSSSGRVPTQKGYRFFVEWLLDLSQLAKAEGVEIAQAYEVRTLDVGEAPRHAAFLLANMTRNAAFVISPDLGDARLERVLLARLSERMAFLVVVSDIGIVEQGAIPLDSTATEDEIERMMRLVNQSLRGATLAEVRRLAEDETEGWHERPERQAILAVARLLEARMGRRLVIEGLVHLIDSLQVVPPGDALHRFASLNRTLRDETGFIAAVAASRQGRRGIVVHVGDFPLDGLEEWSVVTCDYRPCGGVLGVVAPVWMDYGRAMSAVSYVAARLEALLLGGRPRDIRKGNE